MKLYEFEAKHLLSRSSLSFPLSQLVKSPSQIGDFNPGFQGPYVLKAQLLSGHRAQRGGIVFTSSLAETKRQLSLLFGLKFGRESVNSILVEQKVDFDREFFLAFTFSTDTRSPVLLFSSLGGSGVEQRRRQLETYPLSLSKPEFPKLPIPQAYLRRLFQIFLQEDAYLLEINPLAKSHSGQWLVLDAKMILDDAASFRHSERNFSPRSSFNQTPTERELKAHQVNEMDHRGSAGASYFDFGSGVGVLASGGGASIIVMDTLLANHLHPANYTEYSGNPTREKVRALTQVVLSHQLNSLLVVGGNANFTDIYETLMGVMEAVLQQKPFPKFPIVIRRGGPRWQEAFQELRWLKRRYNLNLHLFGPDVPMSFAVHYLVKLLKESV